ncbi:hypothetical protein EMPS_05882 [Entomortierella parvispora]|uniref:Uncharacterized protein n=1 Tax=Entomortierella parvispora TaxID=205924 RepID=A0A9P3LWX5_9FUNG|nr:hypothetical protein EMPS_05882 [Entomortierella parvispora]
MSLFKSSQNMTASSPSSAASTPAHSPRASMDVSRSASSQSAQVSREKAVELALLKDMGAIGIRGPSVL